MTSEPVETKPEYVKASLLFCTSTAGHKLVKDSRMSSKTVVAHADPYRFDRSFNSNPPETKSRLRKPKRTCEEPERSNPQINENILHNAALLMLFDVAGEGMRDTAIF
eukprot:TRINITY_DN40773_c0_g1_i1.p1 TRINITY_DN40773_c0_g1~~TRINITY_DN40773_c0_g1_i1.p1  ORF type:complete len:117 (+),score=3.69 TRINITY_DN40773_c0_g1_i1:28-351(+)